MKKWLFIALLLVSPGILEAQQQQNSSYPRIWTMTLNSSNQIGPDPLNYIDLRGTGITSLSFSWHATGTVSAGACAMQGSADTTTFGTTVIAAQTVTSSGGPTAITTATDRFNRINCTTAIVGSGNVDVVVMGWTTGTTGSLIATGLATEATLAAVQAAVEDTTPVSVLPQAPTSGGWDTLNATAADSATACTNSAQAVKAAAGSFGGFAMVNNPNTADSWVHLYNVAAASVTVGTTAPKMTFRIPGTASNSVAANIAEIAAGVPFSTAIAIACTSTAGANGAPTNALELMVLYK